MNRVQSLIDTDEASTSDQGTSGQESTLNRGGRPQDRFRRIHFKELSNAQGNNNRKALACKSCGAKVESQNLYLQKHCLGNAKLSVQFRSASVRGRFQKTLFQPKDLPQGYLAAPSAAAACAADASQLCLISVLKQRFRSLNLDRV